MAGRQACDNLALKVLVELPPDYSSQEQKKGKRESKTSPKYPAHDVQRERESGFLLFRFLRRMSALFGQVDVAHPQIEKRVFQHGGFPGIEVPSGFLFQHR